MTPFLAFHNDAALRASVIEQVRAHTEADEIIQGEYWENGKGCFIGCIAHSDKPERVLDLTGFPVMLTRIAESIFERLSNAVAKGFPQQVITAPRLGADLSPVAWLFLHETVERALSRSIVSEAARAACQPALDVVARLARGETVDFKAARAAADAARAAAGAVRAAADAACAAAYAAAYAADAAAYAAYAAYAADAAYAAAYAAEMREQAACLVRLLAAAPVPGEIKP